MSDPLPARPADADRQLLFGVLALQLELIDAGRFADACSGWAARRDVELADLLVERGWLTPDDRVEVERLLQRKLKKHGGDAKAELADLASDPVGRSLATLDDPAVRQSLGGLLTPPATPPASEFLSTTAYQTGNRARYTLTRLHATGGIGQVWLARDGDLGRDVALKELRPERGDNPAAWVRFLEEARITGQLEHPGIVPVYELARRPEDQQPFYTMRFIRGRTLSGAIKGYHDKRRAGQAGPLDLRELLGAFVAVCNAIAYAHSRGVIHRDLKGQNVVLGDFGEVIVLDWGLAKVLDAEHRSHDAPPPSSLPPVAVESGDSRDQTLQGQVLGTPAFMAPEQAEGRLDLIDHRTDIYGLGAILYEILTGEPPFSGKDVPDILQQVLHAAPLAPRQRVAESPLALEAVCLKALAKRPTKRYAAAGELAREVQQWLADEPVTAYREPAGVRLGRWVRRHRQLVTGAVALLAAAVVALAVGTFLIGREKDRAETNYLKAEAERVRAEDNFQIARDAVDQYFVQVSQNKLLNVPRLKGLREQLLRSALLFYQKLVEREGDSEPLRAERGRAFAQLGVITEEIGSNQEAIGLMRQSADVYQGLADQHPDNPAYQKQLAYAHTMLGSYFRYRNQTADAEAEFRTALTLAKKLSDAHPNDPDAKRRVADVLRGLATLYRDTARPTEAETLFLRLVDLCQQLTDNNPEVDLYARMLGGAHANFAVLYGDLRLPDKEERQLLDALAALKPLHARHPDVEIYQTALAQVYNNLGVFFHKRDRGRAEGYYRDALALRQQLADAYPEAVDYQRTLALCHHNLGDLARERDDPATAEKEVAAALPLYQKLVDAHPDMPAFANGLALAYRDVALLQNDRGQPGDAVPTLTKAATIAEGVLQKEPRDVEAREVLRDTLWTRAQTHDRLDKNAAALKDWDRALELDDGKRRNDCRAGRAVTLARLGDHDRAAKTIGELTEDKSLSAEVLYDLARASAVAAVAVRRDPAVPTPDQEKRADQHEARAVDLLTRAGAAGYFKKPKSVEELRKTPDLEALRARADFKAWLLKLASNDDKREK